ncbi:V-type ATP synthase subunit D [Gammaproteobacteria bacterium]
MAKIKFSKTELKRQRDQLKQFARFLPTLQLKKQQLQLEVMRLKEEILVHHHKMETFRSSLADWIGLFGIAEADVVAVQVEITNVSIEYRNIAGVDIPILQDVGFRSVDYDPFVVSPWVDTGIETLQNLIRLELAGRVLARQRSLIDDELRVTTQRVNLFEKVKILEARNTIRRIQIYLGDQRTAAVGRAKIVKNQLSLPAA